MDNLSDLYGEWELMGINTAARHPFNDANGAMLELFKPNSDTISNITVLVYEDPDDGYRSAAAAPFFSTGNMSEYCYSSMHARIPVLVCPMTCEFGEADGIEMKDRRNGQTILRLGTANTDDYYPYFVCEWSPQNLAEPYFT